MKRLINYTYRHARRVVITVIGVSIVLFGIAAAVIPGVPAIVVVPIGLAVLGTEFLWARRLLHRLKREALNLTKGREKKEPEPPPP